VIADSNTEAQVLLCNLDIADDDFECLEYVARHEYIPAWPRKFLDAVVWALAEPLAMALKKEQNFDIRVCTAKYQEALSAAILEALRTQTPDPEIDTASILAR
jgi:hypothetical protein